VRSAKAVSKLISLAAGCIAANLSDLSPEKNRARGAASFAAAVTLPGGVAGKKLPCRARRYDLAGYTYYIEAEQVFGNSAGLIRAG
jgi:hypothetical protein